MGSRRRPLRARTRPGGIGAFASRAARQKARGAPPGRSGGRALRSPRTPSPPGGFAALHKGPGISCNILQMLGFSVLRSLPKVAPAAMGERPREREGRMTGTEEGFELAGAFPA